MQHEFMLDGIGEPEDWAVNRRDTTVMLAHAYVEELAQSSLQKRLWQTAMREMNEGIEWGNGLFRGRLISTIHLPLAVYCCATGLDRSPIELAVACSFIELGIDLLDDLADNNVPGYWDDTPLRQIHLVGNTLCYSIAMTVLCRLGRDAARTKAMIQSLLSCSITAAAGLHSDLGLTDCESPAPDEVMLSVAQKSGDTRALFAVLAAQCAGADHAAVGRYRDMAYEYGICMQLLSDCYELCDVSFGRDLINGTRTWPVAWWLAQASPDERAARNRLLNDARCDESARSEVKSRLLTDGAIARTVLEIHTHGRRAVNALDLTAPRQDTAYALLRKMVAAPMRLMGLVTDP
jgi:hypothetical protein